MNRELTRFELAACKRVAANTKSLKTKAAKLNEKIKELTTQRDAYYAEIDMWEAPIITKYGYTADAILSGEYLTPTDGCPTEECNTDITNNMCGPFADSEEYVEVEDSTPYNPTWDKNN